jgi:hypothetical protein
MKFTKTVINSAKECHTVMTLRIGNSFEFISLDQKYPEEYPALLVIDESNSHFTYITIKDLEELKK